MTEKFFSTIDITDEVATEIEALLKKHLEPECPVHFVCTVAYPYRNAEGKEGVYYVGLQNTPHWRSVELLEVCLEEARGRAALEMSEAPSTKQ